MSPLAMVTVWVLILAVVIRQNDCPLSSIGAKELAPLPRGSRKTISTSTSGRWSRTRRNFPIRQN